MSAVISHPSTQVSPIAQGVRIDAAVPSDLPALRALEQSAFQLDRISARSWKSMLDSRSALISVARPSTGETDLILGAAVVLKRAGALVARLYSLAVAPAARRQGIAGLLLEDAAQRARKAGYAVLRLETRVDNEAAQHLFRRHQFVVIDRKESYYEDGADALRFQKALGLGHPASPEPLVLRPHEDQALDFTCGPGALLLAMAALDRHMLNSRAAELHSWREASTLCMAGWQGHCCLLGLALSAQHFGFRTTVYAPPESDGVLVDTLARCNADAIAGAEGALSAALAATSARIVNGAMSQADLIDHVHDGSVLLVPVARGCTHGEKVAHWVVVTGFDGRMFHVQDPMDMTGSKESATAMNAEDFNRITRMGRRRPPAALVVSKDN